jgi:ribosomal protein S26
MENHHHNGGHHAHRKGQKGKGSGGHCTCGKCGYSVSHQAGIPCKTMVCPVDAFILE